MPVLPKPFHAAELPILLFTHDLRQHLRTIMIRAELAIRGPEVLSSSVRLALEEIVAAARSQEALISSVTEFEESAEATARLSFPLNVLVQSAMLEVSTESKAKNAQVRLLPMPECSVPGCIRLVVRKLLENSLKFHKPGQAPEIRVGGEDLPGSVSFFVADCGIGIPDQYRQLVFEPLKGLHSRSVYPGSGMGLSTCRRVVESLGGSISIEGDETLGTLVRVLLPREN